MLILASFVCFAALGYLWVSRKPVDSGWILAIAFFWDVLWSSMLIDTLSFRDSILMVMLSVTVVAVIAVWRRPAVLPELWRSKVLLLLALFLAYALLSALWSVNPAYGHWKWQLLVIRGLFFGLVFFIVFRTYRNFTWKPIMIAGVASCIALLAYGAEEYAGRLSIFGINPIWMARLALLVASVALWDSTQRWFIRLPVFGLAIAAFWGTQSRGPLAAFLLASAIVLAERIFFRKDAKFALRLSGGFLLLAVISFGILFAVPDLDAQYGLSVGTRLEVLYNPSALFVDPNFIARVDLFSRAANIFAEYPLGGVGIGGYAVGLIRDYPHNIVLEIASELGLLGLLLWAATVIFMLRATKANQLLRVMFLQGIFYAMFSGDLAVNYEWLLFGIAAVAVLRSRGEQFFLSSKVT